MGTITTIAKNTARSPERVGQHLLVSGKLTMPASYATGGDTLTAQTLGFNAFLSSGQIVASSGGYTFEAIVQPDAKSLKVKAYRQKDPANAGGADIPGPEVAAAVDLSAITPPFEFRGR